MTQLPSNPDVIVVGAGAAGLSAAKALMSKGLEVVVLEADGHVGGRCITDASTFPVPFDRGGSWLHSAPINPLARIAEQRGEDLHKAPWDWKWVRTPDKTLNAEEVAEYSQYQNAMWAAINDAGAQPNNTSIEAALPPSPWKDTAKHWVAQMLGGDADVTSTTDVHRYADPASGVNEDWLVAGGLGAFIKRLHADVPVKLNCPVTKIDYAGKGVRAFTAEGIIHANHLVLTVSTGVLAAEAIEFTPSLPSQKLTAINQLPTGLLNKVGIEFDPKWAKAHQGETADYAAGANEFCTLLFGFYNTPLAVGFLAGRFADEAEIEGPGAATAFCVQALKDIFGSDITKSIRKTDETLWRSNPYTIGAYSHALPAGADWRTTLADDVDGKLFFAGEATMPTAYATVHGAYMSGLVVADKVANAGR